MATESGLMNTLGNFLFATLMPPTTESAAMIVGYGNGSSKGPTATTTSHDGSGIDHGEMWYLHGPIQTVALCFAYILLIAVGLVGNLLVLLAVWQSPRMRTVSNFFIANLALADLLVIVFCMPATLLSNIIAPWVLGTYMCKIVPYVQGVSVAASVYSLIAVTMNRFLNIQYPLKCHITNRRAGYVIATIWLTAATIALPWFMFFKMVAIYEDHPEVHVCMEVWPQGLNSNVYFLVGNMGLCYLMPSFIIGSCYMMIWAKVFNNKHGQMKQMQPSKMRAFHTLTLVVLVFMFSWLPLYTIFTRIKLGGQPDLWEENFLSVAIPIAQFLGASNSCINPVLYAFVNKKFRRGLYEVMCKRNCCGIVRYNDNMQTGSSKTSSSYIPNHDAHTNPQANEDTDVSYIFNV